MPLLSVITATNSARRELLSDCWASLSASSLGSWDFEWCVQEDGLNPSLAEALPNDPRVKYDANRIQTGAAASRNFALHRARGDWVINLDSDDAFLPGGLEALITGWTSVPDAVWACGRAVDFDGEGSIIGTVPDPFSAGRVDRGVLMDTWATSGRFPILCAGGAMRANVMRALGGYAALPRSEDLALFAAASELGPGSWVGFPVLKVRRWEGQMTRQAWSMELPVITHDVVRARVNALREVADTSLMPS